MKLLLVGGSGYLGKALSLAANQAGISTVITSRKGNGIRLDIRNAVDCRRVLAKVDPDIIMCLAAAGVSPMDRLKSDFDPETNSHGPRNLFQAAHSLKSSTRHILISTAKQLPTTAIQPPDRYIHSKNQGVQNLRTSGCAFLDVRLNNTYGPNQPNDRFVKWLIRELIAGRDPEIQNPNLQCDFVYEADVTQALLQIVQWNLDSTDTIEIRTGIQTRLDSMKEVATALLKQRNRSANKIHTDGFPNAVRLERKGTKDLEMICPTRISIGIEKTIWSMS